MNEQRLLLRSKKTIPYYDNKTIILFTQGNVYEAYAYQVKGKTMYDVRDNTGTDEMFHESDLANAFEIVGTL